MSFTTRTLTAALVGAVSVAAHGNVPNIVINGASYQGYDTNTFPYMADPPVVVGWATTATDLGFVGPDSYSDPDIICHRDATNAGGHAQVAAGDSIFLQWSTWPESHKGPVLDYLAPCGDSGCETVDKTTLEFFKIDEVGLVDGSTAPGEYGDDLLIANSNGWLVEIPTNIAPGFYVLRHEIIALHSAGTENGAQNYPQCFNLEITGSGTEVPAGVLGTELYSADDAGILFNIYATLSTYPVPGPTVIAGASALDQATSAIVSSASATTGSVKATGGVATDAPATTVVAITTPIVNGTTAAATSAAATTAPVVTTEITPAAPTTTAPSVTAVPTTATDVVAAPTTTSGCGGSKKSKRSKKSNKVRRHVRDVAALNVAPL